MRALLDIFATWPMPAFWLSAVGAAMIRRRTGKILVVFAAVLLLVGSLPATGKILLAPLVNAAPSYAAAELSSGDPYIMAIVVFSAGTYVDPDGRWWPLKDSIRRTVAGLQLQRSTNLPVIVTGGSPAPGQPPEAEVIAQFFDSLESRAILETSGHDTFESGKAVADILTNRFPGEKERRVILVTSPSHIARAGAVLRRFEIDPLAAPVWPPPTDRRSAGWRANDFVPSALGLSDVRSVLREYVGIVWYLGTGRVRLRDL